MATLTETELKEISQLERREAVRRFAGHVTWPEVGGERRPSVLRDFQRDFVLDVALFTWTRGFPWSDVIRAATMAKDVFPQLSGVDVFGQLNLLDEARTRWLPDLPPLLRGQLTWYLADACVGSHRLLRAVGATAASTWNARVHLEVQVPPIPLPLAQGMTQDDGGQQKRLAELTAALGHIEPQLQAGCGTPPRVRTTADVNMSALLEAEGVQEWVRAAARQVTASLRQEAALVAELLEPRLQCAVPADRGSRSPAAPPQAAAKQTRAAQAGKGQKK
ncbi:unnamed protein product [Merluccius merluccius]